MIYQKSKTIQIIAVILLAAFFLQDIAYAKPDILCERMSALQVPSKIKPLNHITILQYNLSCLLRTVVKDPMECRLRLVLRPSENSPIILILDFRPWKKLREDSNWIIPCTIKDTDKATERMYEAVIWPDRSFDIREPGAAFNIASSGTQLPEVPQTTATPLSSSAERRIEEAEKAKRGPEARGTHRHSAAFMLGAMSWQDVGVLLMATAVVMTIALPFLIKYVSRIFVFIFAPERIETPLADLEFESKELRKKSEGLRNAAGELAYVSGTHGSLPKDVKERIERIDTRRSREASNYINKALEVAGFIHYNFDSRNRIDLRGISFGSYVALEEEIESRRAYISAQTEKIDSAIRDAIRETEELKQFLLAEADRLKPDDALAMRDLAEECDETLKHLQWLMTDTWIISRDHVAKIGDIYISVVEFSEDKPSSCEFLISAPKGVLINGSGKNYPVEYADYYGRRCAEIEVDADSNTDNGFIVGGMRFEFKPGSTERKIALSVANAPNDLGAIDLLIKSDWDNGKITVNLAGDPAKKQPQRPPEDTRKGFICKGTESKAKFESDKDRKLEASRDPASHEYREDAMRLLARFLQDPNVSTYAYERDLLVSLLLDIENYKIIFFTSIVSNENDFFIGSADENNKTIFLAEDVIMKLRSIKPSLVDEYLIHELICRALGHYQAIFYQQQFFPEHYPDKSELSVQIEGDPYKGMLGKALRDLIEQKLEIARAEEEPVTTGLKKVSLAGERRCDVFLNDADFSKVFAPEANMKAIESALTANHELMPNRRSITVKLPVPVEVSGRLWTSVYLKGVAFDQNLPPVPHRGNGYAARSLAISPQGELIFDKASPSPQSSMELSKAKLEFDNHYVLYHMSRLRSQDVFVSAPLGFGTFPDAKRYHGRKLGFVMLGIDSEMPNNRADTMAGSANTHEKYFKDLGRAYRALHEAGFSSFFLHLGNISVCGNKIYIHDLDHAEFFDGSDATEPRRIMSQIGNIIYFYLKYCNGMYDKYDPWNQFASSYFRGKGANYREAVLSELEKPSAMMQLSGRLDKSSSLESSYFEKHLPLTMKAVRSTYDRSGESAANDPSMADLKDPEDLARNMAGGLVSLSISKKIALVFEDELGGMRAKQALAVFKELKALKKEKRFAQVLKNLEVVIAPSAKMPDKVRDLNANGSMVFMFARSTRESMLKDVENLAHPVYIDETALSSYEQDVYYPLAEIVTVVLAQHLEPISIEKLAGVLKDLDIKPEIKDDIYVFTLLPPSRRVDHGELLQKYGRLKECLRNA
jgi:hypothetical protein